MSKAGNWVPIDKGAVKTLGNLNRPYSIVEALFSHTVDVDCDKPWTYRGYAKQWQWSVGKVKRFVEGLRNTSGTLVERKGNGSGTEVHFIDKGLWVLAEQKGNGSGTVDEHKQLPTSNPNPNPNKKDKKNGCDYPAWLDKNLWLEFKQMRIRIKAPMTTNAELRGIAKLQGLIGKGYTQKEIVEMSIDNCWKGFFEPKYEGRKEPEDNYKWSPPKNES